MSKSFEELEKEEQAAEEAMLALNPDDSVVLAKPEDDKTVETAVAEAGAEETVGDGIPEGAEVKEADGENVKVGPVKVEGTDEYKQKYQVLDGKYKAEIPRLTTELAQWKEYAGELLTRVTALEEAKAKPETAEIPEDDYEVEAFVTDNPGAAKLFKKLEAKHKAEMAGLRDEINSVEKRTTLATSEIKQTTAMGRFEKEMADAGVADWRTIDNDDPGFAEWLNRNPYNIKVLQEAAKVLDSRVVSSFFLDYKRSLEDNGNGSGLSPDNGDGTRAKIDKFIAPPRSGGGGPPPKTVASPVLTKENYAKFSKQAMTPGSYSPAQWGGKTVAQMDAIFDAAIARNELR